MSQENQKKTIYIKRAIFDILLFVAVLFFPWWCFIFFAILGGVLFKNYFEMLIAGFFMDALYGTEAISFHGFRLFFTLAISVLFFSVDALKSKLRFLEKGDW
jgi:hypothetical protein